jgi:hypothetical protein
MSTEKITRQKFALIVAEGHVRAIGQITGFTVHDNRIALEGPVLTAGHPVRDAYLGRPDPVTTGSQNPVGYCNLPEEQQFIQRPCGCGCGELSARDFLPGHDVRAMQQRVRSYFDSSPLRFLEWVDSQLAAAASIGGRDKWPSEVEQLRQRAVELEAQLRSVYVDRLDLLAVLAADPALHPRLAPDTKGLPGVRTVLYLTDDTVGQMSFHVADDDLELVQHVPWADAGDPYATWDGSDKPTVRARLRELVQRRAAAVPLTPN